MQVFGVVISSVATDFELKVEITKVNNQLIDGSSHLKGVCMDDVDKKAKLPVHLILSVNEFATIQTGERLCVGHRRYLVAKYTWLG